MWWLCDVQDPDTTIKKYIDEIVAKVRAVQIFWNHWLESRGYSRRYYRLQIRVHATSFLNQKELYSQSCVEHFVTCATRFQKLDIEAVGNIKKNLCSKHSSILRCTNNNDCILFTWLNFDSSLKICTLCTLSVFKIYLPWNL